jgi:hypothetical protein
MRKKQLPLKGFILGVGGGVVQKVVGVGVVPGFTVGVIGGHTDIILLTLVIGNNVLVVSGAPKLLVATALLVNKKMMY